jgi:hypothetical protein
MGPWRFAVKGSRPVPVRVSYTESNQGDEPVNRLTGQMCSGVAMCRVLGVAEGEGLSEVPKGGGGSPERL